MAAFGAQTVSPRFYVPFPLSFFTSDGLPPKVLIVYRTPPAPMTKGKIKKPVSILRKQLNRDAKTTASGPSTDPNVNNSCTVKREAEASSSPTKSKITAYLIPPEMPDESSTIAYSVGDSGTAKSYYKTPNRQLESSELDQPLNDIANLSGHRILLSNSEVKGFEDGQLENQERRKVTRSPKKQMSPSSAISKLTISTAQPKVQPKTQVRRRLNVAPPTKQLTDYFPVRRSERKCHSNILKEKRQRVEEALRTGLEEGLKFRQWHTSFNNRKKWKTKRNSFDHLWQGITKSK